MRRAVRIRLRHPPYSPRFPRSLRETRKYCACSRIFFDLRAPEKRRFGRQQLTYARFSLSRTEPVPFSPSPAKRDAFARTSPFSEEIRLSLSARMTLENWGKSLASPAQQSEHPSEPLRLEEI